MRFDSSWPERAGQVERFEVLLRARIEVPKNGREATIDVFITGLRVSRRQSFACWSRPDPNQPYGEGAWSMERAGDQESTKFFQCRGIPLVVRGDVRSSESGRVRATVDT